MIVNKDLASNCKRIAKWIKSHAEAIDEESMSIEVPLSDQLYDDINDFPYYKRYKKYLKGINRELRNFSWFDDVWDEHYLVVDWVGDYYGKLKFLLSEIQLHIIDD